MPKAIGNHTLVADLSAPDASGSRQARVVDGDSLAINFRKEVARVIIHPDAKFGDCGDGVFAVRNIDVMAQL